MRKKDKAIIQVKAEHTGAVIVRQVDPTTAESELKVRAAEVNRHVQRLEKAQDVSDELLDLVVSV